MRYLFLFALFALSCKKIEVREPQGTKTPGESNYFVYITNEGNFQAQNASVTRYDPLDGDVDRDVFKQQNNSLLGDVCQSITLNGDEVYVVVNNSSKIEVLAKKNFKRIRTLTGFTSPRYLVIHDEKGYLSDLYANHISVIDLNNGNIIKTIPVNGWTEEMLITEDKLWVTNIKTEYVYLIDLNTESLIDSIHVAYGSSSIVEDKDHNVWVLSQGDEQLNKTAALQKIDPLTKTVVSSFPLPYGSSHLKLNNEKDILYFIANGVSKLAVGDATLVTIIPADGRNFYSLGVDVATNNIYVSDALDYVQDGMIYHYKNDGSHVRSFKAGIIPGNFYFF
jgi:hypothetical protein